jgi:hypothetical protein
MRETHPIATINIHEDRYFEIANTRGDLCYLGATCLLVLRERRDLRQAGIVGGGNRPRNTIQIRRENERICVGHVRGGDRGRGTETSRQITGHSCRSTIASYREMSEGV